ncbi:MAG: TonB-dependent receptor plug domain-containing protein, partial [Desulfobacterales bacterium]
MLKLLAGVVLTATIFSTGVVAADQQPVESSEETLLMFVGETEPVVTVASRLPESPTTAPAMVTVVSREQIDRHGYRTLAEVLNDQVGFYMSAGGRGTVPYLRGLRDSILFLYDGVPLATDVTKNFSVLDREISLDAIERIEIVRGAGSVLWGADAFAGVVNIVPKSGQPQAGVEAGLEVGNDDLYGGTLNWARSEHDWDAFLAAAGLRETLDDADSSHYGELVGTLNLGGWLHLSGRWSDFERNYTMNEKGAEDIRSPGTREAPVNYLKATASKVHGPSHYTLMGFYQHTDFKMRDADLERSQRNHVWHAELTWDRRIMSRGLLTLGASWRRNDVDDAIVRDGFIPLPPGGGFFVPQIAQADFTNDLGSLYAQFRYQLWQGEWWAGLRLDDHSEYE